MARPRLFTYPLRQLSVILPHSLWLALLQQAAAHGLHMSAHVRNVLEKAVYATK